MDRFKIFITVLLTFLALTVRAAQEVPQTFSVDGELFSDTASTVPLIGTGTVKLQLLDRSETCILYEETQNFDTTATQGRFSVQIGSATSGPASAKRSTGDSGNSMATVFSNTTAAPITGKLSNLAACSYSPTVGDLRYLRVLVTPTSDGMTRALSPNMPLESVPNAVVAERAETLRGLLPSDFLRLGTPVDLTQANVENVFSPANYPKLTGLLTGATTEYVRRGTNGSASVPGIAGNATTPAAGQFWFDTSSNVLKYYDGTTVQTLGGSVASTTSGTIGGTTIINTSGNITTTGTLSGNQVSALSVTLYDSDRTNSVTLQTSATGLLTSNYSLTLPVDDGTSGQVLTTNGSGVLSWSAAASGLPSGTDGQFLRNTSGTWGAARIGITDIKSTLGMNTAVFPPACTTSQTLRYDVVTDTFVCTDINLAGSVAGNGILPLANGGTGSNDGSISGSGALTFASGGTNQNITLTPSGTGYTLLNGRVGIGSSSPVSPLDVAGNISAQAADTDIGVVLINKSSTVARYPAVTVLNYGGTTPGSPIFLLKAARGAQGAGAAIESGDALGQFAVQGMRPGGSWSAGASMQMFATETYTSGATGSEIRFYNTTNGTNSSTEKMRIANNGNVGIGTTGPSQLLHMNTTTATNRILQDSTSGGSSHILNSNGGPAYITMQVTGPGNTLVSNGGYLGALSFKGQDGTGVQDGAIIRAEVDGVPAAGSMPGRLTFATTPAGSNTALERIRITNSGSVGIGTNNPGSLLHVGSASVAAGTAVAQFQTATGTCTMTPATTGTGMACSSDERLKENIVNVGSNFALSKILLLEAVNYNFKKDASGKRYTGYLAQRVREVAPEFVRQDDDGFLQVYYDGFIPWITESIKEVYNKVIRNSDRIAALELENDAKETRVKSLEQEIKMMRSYLCAKDPGSEFCG